MQIKSRLIGTYYAIAGDPNAVGLENHFTILSIIVTIFGSIIGFTVNILLEVGQILVAVTGIAIVFYAIVYYIARIKKRYLVSKWILCLSIFVYLDLLWFHNMGSMGPIIYVYIVYYAALLFIWDGKERTIFILSFFLNTLGMFWIEYNKPKLLGTYPDHDTRILDVYSGLLIYLGIASFLMISIKLMYTREKEKAQHSDRLKSAFLANMSHEIRTPMNAIIGFSQLIKRKNLPEEKRNHYLEVITTNGNYLMQIIDDIIDISKIEVGEIKINNGTAHINNLFREIYMVIEQFSLKKQSKNLTISYSVQPPNLVIVADLMRLKQVMLNLLTNAVKYTEEGKIHYSCQKLTDSVLFTVEDTGVGINFEHKDIVFGRFNKVESADGKLYPGTGLGLSIVKNLLDLMGGKIWFESKEPGQGTIFYFTLPAKNSYSEQSKQPENANEP